MPTVETTENTALNVVFATRVRSGVLFSRLFLLLVVRMREQTGVRCR
jgi:hypothetical protein